MDVEKLIEEMQKVKQNYSSLSIDQVLKLFEIKSTQELANQIRRLKG